MMRKLLHTLLFLLTTLSLNYAFAQSNVFDWTIQAGNGGSEYGESVATDAAGNIYATGWFSGTVDFDPGPGVYELSGISGNQAAYVLKLNANGGFEWAYAYNLNITSRGYDIVVDDNGFSYIAGTNGIGSFILTMDSDGNVDDSRNFTKSAIIELEKDVSGNIYATGFFYDAADFDPSEAAFNVTPDGDNDIFVLKLNSDFELQWAKTVGSIGDDRAEDLAVDANGNVYITGYFEGMADFDSGAGTSSLTPVGSLDAFILKLDSSGDFVWAKQLGGANFESANSIANHDNNLYITGRFQNTVDFDPNAGTHELTATSDDAFVLSLNNDGEFQWAGQIGGSSSQRGISITTDKIGNVYTSGLFAQTTDFDFGAGTSELTSAGGFDMYVQKLDHNGNFIFAKQAGGTADDYLHHTFVDDSFNVLTTGRFQSTADFDPGASTFNLTSAGAYDSYIQKLASVVHIPDANFKDALLANTLINTKDDGEISYSEAAAYTGKIDVPNLGINNLIGIEAFVNITELDANTNNLISVDLSHNTLLNKLFLWSNNLEAIDISNTILISSLNLSDNPLTELDVSALVNLSTLQCKSCGLTSLDVSSNTNIQTLLLDDNNLTSINISNLTGLRTLHVPLNDLVNLNLSNNLNLKNVNASGNQITSISLDNLTSITELNVSDNSITVLDVSELINLETIRATELGLNLIDLSSNTKLRNIFLGENNLISIDLSTNTELTDVRLMENQLTNLDLSANTAIEKLFVNDNNLQSLDIQNGNNVAITTFNVLNNPLLTCISVDDVTFAEANWTSVDEAVSFSTFCKAYNEIIFNPIADQLLETGTLTISAISSSGLPVTFEIVSGPVSLAGNELTFTGVGTVIVKAIQPGDDTYIAASTVEQSFEIQKSAQTITFNPVENQFLEMGSIALSASASSGLPVAFEVVSGAASVSGNTLTLEDVGQVTVKATQAGDDTYAPAESVEQSFEIILVTSIPEQQGPQFKFYPNPVSNTLIVMPNGSNNQLSLRNTHGQIVSSLHSTSRDAIQLDVSSLPLGVYVLQVANESGISQTKILKK